MSDDRLPKQLLYGELCYGKRSLGGQKKRFKDTLKKTLTSFNIEACEAQWLSGRIPDSRSRERRHESPTHNRRLTGPQREWIQPIRNGLWLMRAHSVTFPMLACNGKGG